MKYLATYFWTFAFIQMTVYVTGAIAGTTFDFMIGTALSVPCTLCIYILAWLIPDTAEKHQVSAHH